MFPKNYSVHIVLFMVMMVGVGLYLDDPIIILIGVVFPLEFLLIYSVLQMTFQYMKTQIVLGFFRQSILVLFISYLLIRYGFGILFAGNRLDLFYERMVFLIVPLAVIIGFRLYYFFNSISDEKDFFFLDKKNPIRIIRGFLFVISISLFYFIMFIVLFVTVGIGIEHVFSESFSDGLLRDGLYLSTLSFGIAFSVAFLSFLFSEKVRREAIETLKSRNPDNGSRK